ncbi:MAG TPA: hypothetical protein VGH10_06040 [Actinomycetota bacterium]
MVILVIVVLILAALFFVSLTLRRHGESEAPAEDWQRTDEVFRDPTTRRLMRVWVDPRDGSRHYVAEPGPPPSV